MKSAVILLCILLFASSSVGAKPGGGKPAVAQPCDYYASPVGGGNGTTTSSPFRVQNFWPLAVAGKTLCLFDGVYQGGASMITPPPGLNGAAGRPITIRALNEGGVTLDAQFAAGRFPISFLNNRYWTVEGVNAKNGNPTVVRLEDSDNIIIRRVVAWDTSFSATSAVFLNWQKTTKTGENLVEDSAFFGIGTITVAHYSDIA